MTHTWWDVGPAWDYHILEAKLDGDGTLVRDILAISVTTACGATCTVKAVTKRVPGVAPADLVGDNNPCAVDSKELAREIRRSNRARKGMMLFTVAVSGVVATCGGREAELRLPLLPFPFRTQAPPRMARLYDLLDEVEKRVFGSEPVFTTAADTKIFEEPSEVSAEELAGTEVVAELRSGAFDAAIWDRRERSRGAGLAKALQSYVPPERRTPPLVGLVGRPDSDFLAFHAPAYPLLARMARIEGDVEVELTAEEARGAVTGVKALSGHPLLQPAVLAAAKTWRLKPGRSNRVTIRFQRNCP